MRILVLLRWTFEAVVIATAVVIFIKSPDATARSIALLIAILVPLLIAVVLTSLVRWRRDTARFTHIIGRLFDRCAFNVCLLLVLLELGSRGLAVVTHNPIALRADAGAEQLVAANLLEPGSTMAGFTINSLGFFDQEFAVDKKENIVRIVALGDSFAVGNVPYPANYLTLLESLLNTRYQQDGNAFEVYNMGVKGVSPLEYAHILRTRGLRYQPDLVLVGFFVGNDFQDIAPAGEHPRALAARFLTPLVLNRLVALASEWATAKRERESKAAASVLAALDDTGRTVRRCLSRPA